MHSVERSSIVIVHVLRNGLALCGKPGAPMHWEPDHVWVSFQDVENHKQVNCPACAAALQKVERTLTLKLTETQMERLADLLAEAAMQLQDDGREDSPDGELMWKTQKAARQAAK